MQFTEELKEIAAGYANEDTLLEFAEMEEIDPVLLVCQVAQNCVGDDEAAEWLESAGHSDFYEALIDYMQSDDG